MLYEWFEKRHRVWAADSSRKEHELDVRASNLFSSIKDRVCIVREQGSENGTLAQDIALGKSQNVLRALNPMAHAEEAQGNPFRKDDPDEWYRRALDKDN